MRLIENNLIFISKLKDYKDYNKKILSCIDTLNDKGLSSSNEQITKTDWNNVNSKKDYFFHINEEVNKHLEKQCAFLGAKEAEIDKVWYQQYTANASHGWHTHEGAHFSNVYFVECKKGQQTEFKNFEVAVEEGDLISFPAFLPHRSKQIVDSRKTVIAFNTQIHGL
tara:strand:- start:477 stop:977 length:501 start_codon:yes stop_codon:yes gene_type:complete